MDKRRERRIAEYVDSPRMKLRAVDGRKLSARILGQEGTYRVEWDSSSERGSCTCPADRRPCKHMEALRRTWEQNPSSFRDAASVRPPDFPAERLVFDDPAGFVWRCPCGKRSVDTRPSRPEAVEAAAAHVAGHAVHGGLSDEDILEWAEEIQFTAHDRRIRDVAEQARARFEKRECESMGEAVVGVAEELGLEGDEESGEVGEVFRLLERESGQLLWEWVWTSEDEAKIREAVRLAMDRFIDRKHKSMDEAAHFACKELRLEGDEVHGRAGEVFGILADKAPEILRPAADGGPGEWENLSLKEWKPPAPARSKLIRQTIERIRKRFDAGIYESLGDAILDTRNHYGLGGIEEEGETKLVFDLLAPANEDDRDAWLAPRRSAVTLAQALRAVGIEPADEGAKPPAGKCAGCKDPFQDTSFHLEPAIRVEGKRVHQSFECINLLLGPHHPLILRLEDALAGEWKS